MQRVGFPIDGGQTTPRLSVGFWAGWAVGMVATVGAFVGAIYLFTQSGSPGGPMVGGVIVVAFTLALVGLTSVPNAARRRRGFGERTRPAYRRYMWRFLPAMFAYVFLLIAAISYADSAEPAGWVAWAVAMAPVVPLIFAIRAIFLLPREEDDEYQRDRINRSYAWATGATLMSCTTIGFLDMFGVVPHVELWVIFPMWAIFMGIARCLPLGGAR